MHTFVQTHDFSQGLTASFRQHLAVSNDARYLQGSSLRFELHYSIATDAAFLPNLSFTEQLLEENFSARVFVDDQDPHLDWFKMGEKLGVLKLTVIPKLSLSTIAQQVHGFLGAAVTQRATGLKLLEVRISNHRNLVSYRPTLETKDA